VLCQFKKSWIACRIAIHFCFWIALLSAIMVTRLLLRKMSALMNPFFTGHFPETPVFPGVLILEALAQASGALVLSDPALRPEKKSLFLFVGVDDVRFKRPVVPGDQLILKSRISRMKRNLGLFECAAYVDDELAASGQLKCMFKELDD